MRNFWFILSVLLLYTGLQFHGLMPGAPETALWGGTAALFGLMLSWQFLYRSHSRVIESAWFAWLAWIGSLAFGTWATFILLSLPLNLVAMLFALEGRAQTRPALESVLAAAAAIALAGLVQALRGPAVRRVSVRVAGLAPDLEGLTIGQISDLHVGPTIRRGYVERVVNRLLAAAPDLIAVTGDLADGHADRLGREVAPLARLKAPLGAYYVTGNHEYYWGAGPWIDKMAELGCVPLVDCNRLVRRGAATLLVGGVADAAAPHFIAAHRGEPRLAAASDVRPDFRLLLAHRPGACDAAESAGFDLQLSGHTHGGQFFPFSLVVRLAHRYHRGLVRHGRLWLYVSPGTGYWGPPHRFLVPAEITLLRLTGAAGSV